MNLINKAVDCPPAEIVHECLCIGRVEFGETGHIGWRGNNDTVAAVHGHSDFVHIS